MVKNKVVLYCSRHEVKFLSQNYFKWFFYNRGIYASKLSCTLTKFIGYLPSPTINRYQVTLSIKAMTDEKNHLVFFLSFFGFEPKTLEFQPTSLINRQHPLLHA